jgi:hypothetical protein
LKKIIFEKSRRRIVNHHMLKMLSVIPSLLRKVYNAFREKVRERQAK